MKAFFKEYNTPQNWLVVFGMMMVIVLVIGIYGLTKEVTKDTRPVDTALMERLYETCLTKSKAMAGDCADQANKMARVPSLNKPQPQ